MSISMYEAELKALYCKKVVTMSEESPVKKCTKHLHKCRSCGLEWEVSPAYLLSRGLGCPTCRKADQSVEEDKRANRSAAQKLVHANLSKADRQRRALTLGASIKKSGSAGRLSERRA